MNRVALVTCVTLLAMPAAAHAATKDVDLGPPVAVQKKLGERLQANDFFPRGVTIHAGDSVRFVPLGFHNVDIPKRGGKPAGLLVAGGPVAGSVDAAGAAFWFNGQPNLGFNPTVAIGSFGKKVTYTGAKAVQSGLPLSQATKPLVVKFSKAGSYTYFCDVHPGMKGTVRVLAKAKALPTAKQDAKALADQIATAQKTLKGLKTATLPANTVAIGNAGAHGTEYFGFLPGTLTVPHGTTVKFQMSAKTYEVHTATTGPGDISARSSYLGALAKSYEAPVVDPRAAYPSDPPPAPAALTPTLHGNGFWNSGALDVVGATPLPSSSSVTFAGAGTYQFYCLVHPFMHGTVVVT